MREVHICFQRLCDCLVFTELETVIEGYRVAHITVIAQ